MNGERIQKNVLEIKVKRKYPRGRQMNMGAAD
jgi:hypothetical protein